MTKKKKTILVTAGPTREHLDPVRYISNRSSGRLGYAVAAEARKKGYRVILISGPTALPVPRGIRFVPIVSAQELERKVLSFFPHCDLLYMTSAVCDYTPVRSYQEKVKRKKGITVRVKPTADILKKVARVRRPHQRVCGFCLETSNLERNARKKLQEKHLDSIVASLCTPRRSPFGNTQMAPLILYKNGKKKKLNGKTKQALARYLITVGEELLYDVSL